MPRSTDGQFPIQWGRYRLLERLGAGGMAEVFRAETAPVAGIVRTVAIKRILRGPGDPQLADMLVEEARLWVRLAHPNIVGVIDFGEQNGDWFLALELVDGVTSANLVERFGPLPASEALCIVERVAKALGHAHALTDDSGRSLQVIHRDVKPANILLSRHGEVKLTDFGIARGRDRQIQTEAGVVRGSIPFLSPEQVRGEPLDARSDLFSLGATLHTLVTGKFLVAGPQTVVMAALAHGKIPAPPNNLSPAVRELIGILCAPDRGQRPGTALEVARTARAMLLPETPDDVEASIGAMVMAAQGERPSRASRGASVDARGAARAFAPPVVEAKVEAPTVTASSTTHPGDTAVYLPEPPAPPPGRLWQLLRERWIGVAAFGIIVPLVAFTLGFRWLACEGSRMEAAEDRTDPIHYRRAAQNADIICRYCGETAENRAARALAFARAGDLVDPAGLGHSPVERRAAAVIRVAQAHWDPALAQQEIAQLTADGTTGDASHTRWGWEHGVEPGTFSDDQPESRRSLAALKALVAEHPSIEVRLGHQY